MTNTPDINLRSVEPDWNDRFARVQRRTMGVLVVTQIVGTVGTGVAPSIGVLLASDVLHNETWAGLARTTATLGAALLGLPLGNLAARRGRRFSLATGWWLAAAGAAILVPAAQLKLVVPLFLGLLLIGSGSAVALQSRFAATDLANPGHKARALALIVWVGTLGSVIGPNLGAPGTLVGDATGLSVYAGAFLIAAICLGIAGTVVFVLLRPDPLLLLTESGLADASTLPTRRRGGIRRILAEIRSNKPARIAVIAILVAQIVMVTVMTMTPVHIVHQGGTVNLVGITISLHIVGMYALAPLVGWITDRCGSRLAIWAGIGIFVVSLAFAVLRSDESHWVVASLILLGVGWSFVNVAGSALFTSNVSTEVRASSQGGIDALANLCGATMAFLAGPLMAATSFATLAVIAMVMLIPLACVVLRRIPETIDYRVP
ncbi:MFS transporter [Propionimicrobium sp. PCR01-08-3]|uniref:MFS transporter n=1 Tax=Propionimicrobium sp. PCR01-08-3 TaxID=3052086 RepID=UPI00255CAC65|nr:MFS transporter [Propionimicrobium sp. PCR01-08-3]WIY82733.1 MFS transporter [Propionimicrobium sp. PCR01-08-3]